MNQGEFYSPHLGRPLKVYLAGASDLHTRAWPLIWSFLRGPLSQLFDLSGDVIFIDDDELTTQIKRQTAENQGAVSSHSGLLHYSVFLLWNIYIFLFSDFLFEWEYFFEDLWVFLVLFRNGGLCVHPSFPGIHDVCWERPSRPATSWLGWVHVLSAKSCVRISSNLFSNQESVF